MTSPSCAQAQWGHTRDVELFTSLVGSEIGLSVAALAALALLCVAILRDVVHRAIVRVPFIGSA